MRPLLIIACGALAREVGWVIKANGIDGVDLTCLPAELHNYPDRITPEMADKIDEAFIIMNENLSADYNSVTIESALEKEKEINTLRDKIRKKHRNKALRKAQGINELK